MVGKAIKHLLTGFANKTNNPQFEIYQYVGERVYPGIKPQNVGLPALVYTIDNQTPVKVKGQRGIANRSRFDVTILSDNYKTTTELSTLIINHLHRYENNYNSNERGRKISR